MLVKLPIIDEYISAFMVSALTVHPHQDGDGSFSLRVWCQNGEADVAIMFSHRFESEAEARRAKGEIGEYLVAQLAAVRAQCSATAEDGDEDEIPSILN